MSSMLEVGMVDLADLRDDLRVARRALARAETDEVLVLARAARRVLTRPDDRDLRMRAVAAELACAERVSDRTMQRRLDESLAIVDGHPAVFAAWRDGRIARAHAMVIVEAGSVLAGTARAAFELAALERAETETPNRLRAALARAVEAFRTETFQERHVAARATRCVSVASLPDGMALLTAVLPAVLAFGIHDRLTQQARAVKRGRRAIRGAGTDDARPACIDGAGGEDLPGADADERTQAQIRADVFSDLLLTAAPAADPTGGGLGAIRALVQVDVPLLTLMGDDATPAELVGRSPIDPETARVLAGAASGWDRVMTHPISKVVLTVDRYQPSEELKRILRARDRHCRFPGCRIPALRSEADHTIAAAEGGPTCASNLAHLCIRHHKLKHHTEWGVRQLAGGVLAWTSPTGRVYIDRPPSAVVFTPDAPPPF